jgi:hypothetical protein
MALRQEASVDQLDRLVWQIEQANGMCDVGAASAEPL